MARTCGCYNKCAAWTGEDLLTKQRSVKIATSWVFQELEDAGTPDEKVNSTREDNLNLRIKELEKSEQKLKGVLEDYVESDSILRNRMKELELSHKTLLVMVDQLYVKLDQVENANVRIKGKLRDIQEDLISLVENQKKSEKKHKEKLRWLQEQLKTKEDEIKSQSEYFEHYKQRQRQQTAVLRKRDCYLQGEVSRLEKQVLDLNAHIALLTSKLEEGLVQHLQQNLQSVCSGTQGCKHPRMEEMEWKTCIENVEHDVKSHLKAFQQNLKLLREKEEDTRREQADLLTELQCFQNTEDFLRTKLEESHHHVYSLKLSEIKLQEKVEELLDENRTLKEQGTVKLKKKKEKDSELTRLVDGDNSVNLNGDLIQDEVHNLKRRAVLDSLRSRATQTPVVLLHDKESETPACSCDGLKPMEELPEEIVPVLEYSSSAIAKAAGLAETEQVTLGPQRANNLEDSFTLPRCTPSHRAAGLLPPCPEKLPSDETSKEAKDEETFFLLKEHAITLPVKTFPASVVEILMRKKLQLILFEPGICHVTAFTTENKVRSLSFCVTNTDLWSDGLCIIAKEGFYDRATELLHGKLFSTEAEIFTTSLEECNMEKQWGNMQILPKSEEKCVLKREIDRINQETSEQFDEFQKTNTNIILEKNLKVLMSSLGFTYEELRKEKSIGPKKNTVKLKEERQQPDLKRKKVQTEYSVIQTEEHRVPTIDPSDYSPGEKDSMFESYSMMKEQVRKAEEELKIQQKELEKSKKEAQKWYRELGFAETRYEETKTHLMQALSELDRLKQEVGDKMQGKQHCKLMPVYTLKDAQEKEVNKICSKRLEQQVLTLKAQLRDQAALQNQFHDLQKEVELLQAQLCEKEKELQKSKSEVKLTLAPLKAKLACLTQKCQERNSFIRRMHDEFQKQGFINSVFDEEMKSLVNDMTLAEYTVAFTPMCDQEMLPSSTEDHVGCATGMAGSVSVNFQSGVDGPHSSPITPNVCAGSSITVTSPERILALQQELGENHCKNCQGRMYQSHRRSSRALKDR
ncbi:uncharacterized protein C4orf50 homolog isoform X2 [Catharus ustulatus]|nr:uncharacterized protein C4orf50 homolog isoform X2 [Catharus ustulatus]